MPVRQCYNARSRRKFLLRRDLPRGLRALSQGRRSRRLIAGTASRSWAAKLLQFWFHDLEPSQWFGSNEQVDQQLRIRFERKLLALGGHPAEQFTHDPKTAQAAILLFDQVPRNIYRDTEKSFAFDHLARAICKTFIAQEWDAELPDKERQFIAMPLMHSEQLADQEASVKYFGTHLPGNLSFARKHHEMIEKFSRFPHRNDALGRETTPEEQAAIDAGFSW